MWDFAADNYEKDGKSGLVPFLCHFYHEPSALNYKKVDYFADRGRINFKSKTEPQ